MASKKKYNKFLHYVLPQTAGDLRVIVRRLIDNKVTNHKEAIAYFDTEEMKKYILDSFTRYWKYYKKYK